MPAALPPTPLTPPQLAVIQAPLERNLPALVPRQPNAARAAATPPAATGGRGRIVDIVV
jgi:hypothetical protein